MPRRVSVDFVLGQHQLHQSHLDCVSNLQKLCQGLFSRKKITADSSPTCAKTPCGNLACFKPFAFVDIIDLDPSDSDVVESPIDKEDDVEPCSTNESPEADLTAAFVAIAPEERITLSRKRRKHITEGLENLSTHDHCVQYLCGCLLYTSPSPRDA